MQYYDNDSRLLCGHCLIIKIKLKTNKQQQHMSYVREYSNILSTFCCQEQLCKPVQLMSIILIIVAAFMIDRFGLVPGEVILRQITGPTLLLFLYPYEHTTYIVLDTRALQFAVELGLHFVQVCRVYQLDNINVRTFTA